MSPVLRLKQENKVETVEISVVKQHEPQSQLHFPTPDGKIPAKSAADLARESQQGVPLFVVCL